jgi:oligopeptidase B
MKSQLGVSPVMTSLNLSRRTMLLSSLAIAGTAAHKTAFAQQVDRQVSATPAVVSVPIPAGLPAPPVAATKPYSFTAHGVTIEDPWDWLYDRSYPTVDDKEVLAYLEAENSYFNGFMAPRKAFTDKLFEEIKARVKQDDSSVPQQDGDWIYQSRFEKGAQYRKWYRWAAKGKKSEQLILDEPALAKGKEYFRLRAFNVSPDGKLLAYSTDTNGSERFTIQVKDLTTGKLLADKIPETNGGVVWQADSKAFAYTPVEKEWRTKRVKVHALGTPAKSDKQIYNEKDIEFSVGIGLVQSRSHMVIGAGTNDSDESRIVPTSNLLAKPVLVAKRRKGIKYDFDVRENTLYIRTNDGHVNFQLMTAPAAAPQRKNWKLLIAGSDEVYFTGLSSFKNVLAIAERVNGLDQVRLRTYDGKEHRIQFPEASYTANIAGNPEYEISQLRLSYTSMITPNTVYDYDLAKRELITRKVQEIPSGYDKNQYATERLMAPSRDGKTMIPISVVYKKGFEKNGKSPLWLYAYGAYGIGMDPAFSASMISMLDRGFAYAIAHIRGGDEMGYNWYLQGKADKRWNTFNDFVDCAQFMIKENWTSAGQIAVSGGSAGGKLMGVVYNTNPELWRAVVAHVPFVTVLQTILDDKLPLTPGEWQEWGNPITDKAAFDYIRSYCPYLNVSKKAYPPMLVTAGLNDPRVTYWEPAKWVAKLRATRTDSNVMLLKTNMGAGHGGKSGRFDSLYERAEEFSFILSQFGVNG